MYHIQVVFFGFLCGSPVWGVLADKIGRKKVTEKRNTYVCITQVVYMYMPVHMYNRIAKLLLDGKFDGSHNYVN